MKVKQFSIEDSKRGNGKILVAECENGEKFVIAGDSNYSPVVVPYDAAWDSSRNNSNSKVINNSQDS